MAEAKGQYRTELVEQQVADGVTLTLTQREAQTIRDVFGSLSFRALDRLPGGYDIYGALREHTQASELAQVGIWFTNEEEMV